MSEQKIYHEQSEIPKLPEIFLDIFEMTDDEKKELKERIAQWEGTLRVFVHPFFIKHGYAEQTHHHFPGQERTGTMVKRIVAKEADQTPPVLILQEAKTIKRLAEELEEASQVILIARTVDNDPDLEYGRDFEDLKKLFVELGVKRLLVGGQFLYIDEQEVEEGSDAIEIPENYGYENMEPWLGGCTGKAIKNLKDPQYKIYISYSSYPDNLKKLRSVFT